MNNYGQIQPFIPNIVQFCCGTNHKIIIDANGDVFSVGKNSSDVNGCDSGQLGLGHNTDQHVLNRIPNIPPMQSISTIGNSNYLLDFYGNVWSFGSNAFGQLGHGNKNNYNTPTIINSLKNIKEISHGTGSNHFFAKDIQNKIYYTGKNRNGQLGTSVFEFISIPKEMNFTFFPIWGSQKKNYNPSQDVRSDDVNKLCNELTTKIDNLNSQLQEKKQVIQSLGEYNQIL